jgi:sporulation protein YlmC with PRC-barrel domain
MTKDDFDIQTGMSVYGPNGEKIGTIASIAGFGSTRIHEVSEQQADGLATQASSGTGYVRVDQKEILGSQAEDLVVPFNRITEVKPGHGVILHDAVVPAVQGDPSKRVEPAHAEAGEKPWWQLWGSGKKG